MARKGSIVTASIIRTDSEIGVYENGIILDGSIPDGIKPNIEVQLVANKNAGTAHTGVAVWHFTPDGKVRLTNPSKDRAIYTGTVTYLTEDN